MLAKFNFFTGRIFMKIKLITAAAVVTVAVLFSACVSHKNDAMSSASKKDMKKMDSSMNMTEGEMMMSDFVLESGTVTEGDGFGMQLRIKSAAHDEVIFNIQEKTPTIDATTGASTKKAAIKTGVPVYAWVSPAYTASLPPQTAAQVLFVNVHDESALPVLAEIAEIDSKDDVISLTATNGSKWTFSKNIEIGMHPVAAMGKADAAALKKGVKILLWETDKMMMNGTAANDTESSAKTKKQSEDMMMDGKMGKMHKAAKILIIS